MTDDEVRLERRKREDWSLKDEFAARAMQALLGLATAGTEADFEMVAQIAYDMADAMMAQREKRP